MALAPSFRSLAVLAAVGLCVRPAAAEVPRFLTVEGFAHLLEGSPDTTALSEDGAIGLRPRVHERFGDAAFAGGTAGLWGDEVIMSRLDGEPHLVAVGPAGKVRPLLPLGERIVTRLVGAGPTLWIATTGKAGAKLQRMGRDGLAQNVSFGQARYVWDLLPVEGDGVLVATGEPGQVLHVDGAGKAEVLFAASEAHIKAVAYDPALGTFAGGGERGVLYHGAPWPAYGNKGTEPFRALLDTRNNEVTSLLCSGNQVFVAAVSGSITAAGADEGEGGAKGQGAKVAEVRSSLLRVDASGAADLLAGSTDEMIFDLAKGRDGEVLVATGATSKHDPRGRLYRVEPVHKVVSLLYQAPSRRLTQLLPRANQGPLIVAQESSRILALGGEVDEHGEYTTAPLDTGANSRFGAVQVLGEFPQGTRGEVAVRTGQTREPDNGWSRWSKPVPAPGNDAVAVPNGRYAQVRLTLHGREKARPQVFRLRLAYLRQNLPPFVREVAALDKGLSLIALPQVQTGDESRSKVVSWGEKAEDAGGAQASIAARPPLRVRQVVERGALTVKWTVDEPNGDEMRYDLYQRPASGGDWQLVKADLEVPFYTFHSAQLADGHYTFRVRATDAPSNPQQLALQDVRDSRAVLVDNTPPAFSHLRTKLDGRAVTVTGEVRDELSPLTALHYALDGAALRPMAPADGLADGLQERVQLRLESLDKGCHAITIRARDEADNEGYAQLHFEVR